MEAVDALIARFRKGDDDEREAIKAELEALCRGPQGASIRDHIEHSARAEVLEVQWELEEIVENTTPPKETPEEPEPEPEEEAPPEPDKPLTSADLDLVYDDPRGLLLHRTKDGKRWFATQVNPNTGQPQTFELQDTEISQLKMQLSGSPHWQPGAP